MTPENLGFTDNCITVKTKGDDYAGYGEACGVIALGSYANCDAKG